MPYLRKNALPCALRCALLLMPGGVGGAVQAARFAGGLGAACCVLGSVRRGAFPSQGRVQHVPVWLLVRRRSDRGRGGCCSRRGLRSASSAGPLLLGAGLWSCWWFSPCLICGWSPRRNMDAAGNAGGGLAVWFFPIVSAGRRPVSSCKRKSLSGLIVGRAFVLSGGLIVWGCGCCTASSVGGWVSDLGCVGVCCVCPGCRRAV